MQAALIVAAAVVFGAAPMSDWPQYRGNSGITGVSPDSTVKPPLKFVWSYRLDGDASGDAGGGLTVAAGKVFLTVANTRSVLALDAETGGFLWEYFHQDVHYKPNAAYSDGRLYVWRQAPPRRSAIVALDAATGTEVWTRPLEPKGVDIDRSGPILADGRLFCVEGSRQAEKPAPASRPAASASEDADSSNPAQPGAGVPHSASEDADSSSGPAVLALDPKTGEVVWRTPLGVEDGLNISAVTVAAGVAFVGTWHDFKRDEEGRGAVIALSAADGRVLWRNRDIYPTIPLVSDGRAVLCQTGRAIGIKVSPNQKTHLLDAKTGTVLWSVPNPWTPYSPASLTDDLVLLKPYGSDIVALERKTGKGVWRSKGKGRSGCCPSIVAGGYAYVGTGCTPPFGDMEATDEWSLVDAPRERGLGASMCAVDLTTGETAWFFATGNTVCGDPAIACGRLYFTSRDGRVYCFAPAGEGEPETPEAKDTAPNAPAEEVKALVAQPVAPPRPGLDWPMQGGSPDRAGLEGVTLTPLLEPAWTYTIGGRIVTAPAIRDGRVFAASESGLVVAVEAESGRKAWAFETGRTAKIETGRRVLWVGRAAPVRSSPAVAGGMVYVGAENGLFYALDAATGQKKWEFICGGPVQASPAVVGGLVVFAAEDHHTYALDRATGRKLWSFRSTYHGHQAPPVVHGERVFTAAWHDWVQALDLTTGKLLWRSFVPVSIEALAYHRDRLYARAPGYVVELEPETGKRLRLVTASYGYGGLGFMKNLMFLSGIRSQYGTAGGTVTDLDGAGREAPRKIPTLEEVRWLDAKGLKNYPALSSMGTPLVVGELVCFAAVTGEVFMTQADGTRVWSAKLGGTCHSSPVAAGGLLVVGCDDGRLYAFRQRPAPTP